MKSAPRDDLRPGARKPGADVYTVRILYRDREAPGTLMGVVEEAGVAGQRGFVGKTELWRILDSSGRVSGGGGRRPSVRGADSPPNAVLELIRRLREEQSAPDPGDAR